jgi:probable selenium-dependent hydroxylase accessory protein YqeC
VAGLAEVDVLICEADGAAGRPLKVHGPGEPVVPPCTTHLLICVGVDALGGCSEAAVHRLPEFSRRYGDAVVSIEIVAEILADLLRFTPPGARAFFLVNKIDDRAALRRAEPLVTRLAQLRPGVPAVLACRGRVRAYPTRAAVAPPR